MGSYRQLIKLSQKLFYSPLSLFKLILQNMRLLKGKGKEKEKGGVGKEIDLLLIVIKGNHKSTGAVQ